jgi:hypothetical protein
LPLFLTSPSAFILPLLPVFLSFSPTVFFFCCLLLPLLSPLCFSLFRCAVLVRLWWRMAVAAGRRRWWADDGVGSAGTALSPPLFFPLSFPSGFPPRFLFCFFFLSVLFCSPPPPPLFAPLFLLLLEARDLVLVTASLITFAEGWQPWHMPRN